MVVRVRVPSTSKKAAADVGTVGLLFTSGSRSFLGAPAPLQLGPQPLDLGGQLVGAPLLLLGALLASQDRLSRLQIDQPQHPPFGDQAQPQLPARQAPVTRPSH